MVYGLRLIRLQYGNMSQNEGFYPNMWQFFYVERDDEPIQTK